MNEKTSKDVASAAARVLRDPEASQDAKSAAGSALTQYEPETEPSKGKSEQERAEFEAWCRSVSLPTDKDACGDYIYVGTHAPWLAWQARAALQSQDREDAERYRAWRKAAASQNGNFLRLVSNELPDWDEGAVDEEKIDAAIDHARRVEGADDA